MSKYWTKAWNPITGCLPDYPCWERCWARAMDKRFGGGNFDPTFHPERLEQPLHWRKPQIIATCWMGDMFAGENIREISVILDKIWKPLNQKHRFLLLTKRLFKAHGYSCPDNLWIGTSISTQADADERIPQLMEVDCKHRWLSVEPILEPIKLNLEGIEWVVVGGETGRTARQTNCHWIEDVSVQCEKAEVTYYFKQYGQSCFNQFSDRAIFHTRGEYPVGLKEIIKERDAE